MTYCKSEPGYIYLEDGTLLEGCGFGSKGVSAGEVVFSTAMNGYPESLTDPSYRGQILVLTHPLVGNYGVPRKQAIEGIYENFESDSIQVEGLVVTEVTEPYKWNSERSLHKWLEDEGVPGVSDVDTRAIVSRVRRKGSMMGVISSGINMENPRDYLKQRYDETDFSALTSPKTPVVHKGKGDKGIIVMIDCGTKHGIIKGLYDQGFTIVRVPCWFSVKEVMDYNPKAIVFGNGPGNPNIYQKQVKNFREILEYKLPTLGICLGHQLLSISMGGKVTKMKFGHRAINKAVVDVTTGEAYITTHNHGYAIVSKEDVPSEMKVWFYNPDDGTIEGLYHDKLPIITTQFHPEARPGPWDATWVFKKFAKMVESNG
ncbi:glutamine-hydrolyzing carbamoyl-phosphate synthase small subunit [Sulfuracidifex tepidarius]|uniref:Carbamoyl phosphate synthase small chain n=1 Tax=Sulfuracidifex tepidarius TaxID=1294262 RepID=A0A510DV55_9CREN|nr:glutamine-hydrolyzing carbamoyl-phosphate synthase small subunit [Sulfuracidifex tepidarius]BBG24059.1 GMP synthase [glutamine-hydrolyzing] subunit A [Sulfuracidifex tepidarius]BBG26814.1 GMP synthase [glutamine-hydrolyzing] subunit A [Sulfuracidifex tepidarius]